MADRVEDANIWHAKLLSVLPAGSGGSFRWHKTTEADEDAAARALLIPLAHRKSQAAIAAMHLLQEQEAAPGSESSLEDERFAAQLEAQLAEYSRNADVGSKGVLAALEAEFGSPLRKGRLDDLYDAISRVPIPVAAAVAEPEDKAGPAGLTAPFRVLVATMNVGNAALNPQQLQAWLGGGCGAEVIAVGLQESVAYDGYPDQDDSEEDDEEEDDDGGGNGGGGEISDSRSPSGATLANDDLDDPLDDGGGAAGVNAGVGLRGSPAFSLCAVFLLISQRGRAGPRGFFLRHHRVLWNNRSGPVPVRWDLLSRRRGVYI